MNLILTGLFSGAAVVAVYLLIHETRFSVMRRIQARMGTATLGRHGPPSGTSLFRGSEFSSQTQNRTLERFHEFLDQTGLAISASQVLITSLVVGAVFTLIGIRLGFSPLAVALIAGVGLASPMLYLSMRRQRRVESLRRQLPDAFDMMTRAIQAGQTVPAAIQTVSLECRPQISREFACCCEQQNLGLTFEASLRDLARRVPITELHMLSIALIVQRQCDGNPTEVMNNMSELVRKRMKLAQRLRALTGEGRMQALVLTLLPICAFAGLFVLRPEYAQVLLDRPMLLAGIGLADVIGCLWIRQIIRVDF